MNSTPLVSVIVITYNHAPYIERCLLSILEQETNFDFEILVGEDCSTDNTAEEIRKIERKFPGRLNCFYRNPNLGMMENFYDLLKRSQGKFLAFLEGDDIWIDKNKLQSQADFLQTNRDYGLMHTDYDLIYLHKNYSKKNVWGNIYRQKAHDGDIYREMLLGKALGININTAMIRSALLRDNEVANKVIQQSFIIGDVPIALCAAAQSKIGYFPRSTLLRQVPLESASQTKGYVQTLKFKTEAFRVNLFFENEVRSAEAASAITSNMFKTAMNIAFNYNQKDDFLHYFRCLSLSQKRFVHWLMLFGMTFSPFYRISNLMIRLCTKAGLPA